MKENDTKYLHAAARVHSLENKMITQQDLMKAIEANNPEDAFKVLSGNEMFKEYQLKDYEDAFENDLFKSYQLIENITDKSELTYVFRYPVDGHNLKVFVKSQAVKGDFSHLYKKTGTFSIEKLEQEMASKKFEAIPADLGRAALEAMDRLAKTQDSQIADIIIDKAVLELMHKKAYELGNSLLKEYVASRIDLINIETALRLSRIKKDAYEVKKYFVPGGTIEEAVVYDSYAAGFEGIRKLAERAGKKRRLEKSILAVKQGENLTTFEQNLDACFRDLFDKAKTIPFGPEPVIAYMYLKEREIRAARLVLTSKIFGLSKEIITERLGYIYAD